MKGPETLSRFEASSIMAAEATILLADDNRDDATLMRYALRKAGFNFRTVHFQDGREVIRYLAGESPYADRDLSPFPFLVLLEMKLPRVDGLEVLRWIRSQPSMKDLPVVLLSGAQSDWHRQKAIESGATLYLEKPLGFNALVELVHQQLGVWLQHPLSAAA
jgi:CheY-like chemotaxis protein